MRNRQFQIILFCWIFVLIFQGCGTKAPTGRDNVLSETVALPKDTPAVVLEKSDIDSEESEIVYQNEYIGSSIAVLYFDNNTPVHTSDYDFLSKWISGRVTESLGLNSTIRLVERNKIDSVLEELDIGSSALIDKKTSLDLGKLIAADYFVFGNYFVIQDSFYCTVRLVEVSSGIVVKAEEAIGSISDLTRVANKIIDSVLIGLGRKIHMADYKKTGSRENMDIALFYVRGMEYLENGDKDQAIESFMYILKFDKNNWWAKRKIKEILGPGAL